MTPRDAPEQHDRTRRASPRNAAERIARELRDRGHTAYFAGGCVRDELLGLDPKDYDVATDARPEEIRTIFRNTHGVGAAFGVVLVRLMGQTVEVTTFRDDGAYSDGRHPDRIVYADAERDARRRDFTINGLYEDPLDGRIIDYVGGREDLERGVIRAIGDPRRRFEEDHLRMLRAVRFAARYGFDIEDATRQSILEHARHLEGVSRERIGQEVEWMLVHPSRARAAGLVEALELDEVILQEPHITSQTKRLAALPDDAAYPTALAAWWLDRWAAREDEPDHPPTHWRDALVLSNRVENAFLDTLDCHRLLVTVWEDQSVAGQKRLASKEAYEPAVRIVECEDPARAETIRSRVRELAATGLRPDPLLDGRDLIDAGMEPGPAFKRVLEGVYDAQLEGRVRTRDEALAMAQSLADAGGPSTPRPEAG